ncbi:PAS domain-containing protein [Hyphococcus luteus]|uniref:PAS domain-containing protein n=1 Tax=Hyphococcus luteus TaxID=2058213 RepID=A0A2S7K2G2_9PROT|nr:PAS domain-containing protein [Marinicaulis flavus]PQA86694.1 hypothetical protein CW354_14470 [Marinicaulis flavus]
MSEEISYAAGFAGYDAFLKGLMAAAPDMMVACDGDFRILSGNEAARACLGRRESAFLGRAIDDFLPSLSADLRRLGRGPFLITGRRACRHNGDSFPVEIRGYAGAADGETRYLLFICDLSKQASADEQRGRVQQLVEEGRTHNDIVFERVQP